MTEGAVPPAGWYPDPWFSGQHRYWTGSTWTGDVFPDGPAGGGAPHVVLRPEWERPPVSPPTGRSDSAPPAPGFAYTATLAPPAQPASWELLQSPPPAPRRQLAVWQISALALVVGLVAGFVVVEQLVSHRHPHGDVRSTPAVPFPVPSLPPSTPASNDPSASVLQGLVVRQQDVPSSSSVQLLDGGNLVVGQTTLDLCNGTYATEALRTARLQVVEYRSDGTDVLSTEAVLYRTASDAAQAMAELRSVAARCPNQPVVSPVGEPTVTTQFTTPPDRSWPTTARVTRQAYAFTVTDTSGQKDQAIAVYLRRGRLLEGLYFHAPTGAQPAVDGQTTVAGITGVFERRIAAVPAARIGA